MTKVLRVSTTLAASLGMSLGMSLVAGRSLLAQIVPDDTLGAEGSRLTPNVQIRGDLADRIDGGAIRADVLFHSFSEFNVGELQRLYFANPAGIESIFGRVTGTDVSDIMGTLGVDGPADLFLLNPNGILFGPNARLDIAGSFMATTADGFEFAEGQVFSAVNPDAPPLLTMNVTPGLQWGSGGGDLAGDLGGDLGGDIAGDGLGEIRSLGQLVAGESLTLVGDRLQLSGSLTAGQDLNLRSPHAIQIEDSATAPFMATAGRHLRIQGESIDIFALNHGDSGLTAGGNLILRSDNAVIGDAHFDAGGEFRVERSDGGLGRFTSLNDPVIRAAGDVSFQDYTGASLHILAGGRVTIPGPITITGADSLDRSLREAVTLSDGATVVEIDGNAEPTLDIRAGMRNSEVAGAGVGSSANIRLGEVRNPGGLVFLSNQYRPNRGLSGGDIRVGAIDTSVSHTGVDLPLDGVALGGDVVIDARGDVEITGNVTTAAGIEITAADLAGLDAGGDIGTFQAFGGDILLLAGDNITTRGLDGSAIASITTPEIRTLLEDGTERVERGDGGAIARGGNVTAATLVRRRNEPIRRSTGNIVTGRINTSAQAIVEAAADASVVRDTRLEDGADELVFDGDTLINTDSAGVAIGGSVTALQARGGDVSLSTDVVSGEIRRESDVGNIRIRAMDTSAIARADVFANASVIVRSYVSGSTVENSGNGGVATGGAIGDSVSRGGRISLRTNAMAGDINAAATIGGIQTTTMNSSASANTSAFARANAIVLTVGSAENLGNGGNASSGELGDGLVQGGAINITADVAAGDIRAESDVGVLNSGRMRTRANIRHTSDTFAFVDIVTGDSDFALASNTGDGGHATRSAIGNMTSSGGAVTASTHVRTGNIAINSNIGNINTDPINAVSRIRAIAGTSANATATSVFALTTTNHGSGGTALSRRIGDVVGQGGDISLSTTVSTGHISASSDMGRLRTRSIRTLANVLIAVDAQATATATATNRTFSPATVFTENLGNGGQAIGGTVGSVRGEGGAITVSDRVLAGEINSHSDVGGLQTGRLDSSTYVRVDSYANAYAYSLSSILSDGNAETGGTVTTQNRGNGGRATGGLVDGVSSQSGTIMLSTQVNATVTDGSPTLAVLQAGPLTTSSTAFADVSPDAAAEAFQDREILEQNNEGTNGSEENGRATASAQGGNIVLRSRFINRTAEGEAIRLPVSASGSIMMNTLLSSSARTFVDAVAEGQDTTASEPMFRASGGSIHLEADGRIELGETSALNASAGSLSIRSPGKLVFGNSRLQGGDIRLTANGDITLNQVSAETNAVFEINGDAVEVETLASAAGEVEIQTLQTVRIEDEGTIAVTATGGEGQAGNIEIGSRTVILGEQSRILSETESGDGGDITINLSPNLGEFLIMEPGSAISTSAGTNAQGGDGGNITLNAHLIQAIPQGNSDIAANAFTGNGGNISITTEGIFGLEPRTRNTLLSDITATSTLGLDGTININRLSTDPSQGLVELATIPTEPPQIYSLCDISIAGGSEFHILGRGGIPASPADTISSSVLWEDWHIAVSQPVALELHTENQIDGWRRDYPSLDPASTPNALVVAREHRPVIEAQDWIKTDDGQIHLITNLATASPSPDVRPNCRHPHSSSTS